MPITQVQYSGIWCTQVPIKFTPPKDPRYRGCLVSAMDEASGYVYDARQMTDGTGKIFLLFPTPSTVRTADVWFQYYSDKGINPIVPGVTPRVVITIGRTGGVLDLAMATPGTLQTAAIASGLEIPATVNVAPNSSGRLAIAKQTDAVLNIYGGKRKLYSWDASAGNYYHKAGVGDFEADSVTSGIVAAGVIATRELATGELLVGLGGGKPTKLKVVDGFGSMVMFCGYDPATGFVGLRAINAGFGPDPNNPNFYSDAAGTYIQNTPFTLNLNGVLTEIASLIDPWLPSTVVGFRIKDVDNNRILLYPQGITFVDGVNEQSCIDLQSLNGRGRLWLGDSATGHNLTASLTSDGYIALNGGPGAHFSINGYPVLGPQQAAVTAPSGGSTIDSQARTAISSLIARLQAHGLIG